MEKPYGRSQFTIHNSRFTIHDSQFKQPFTNKTITTRQTAVYNSNHTIYKPD
ncbi:MAG: hypothetical protein GY943_22005 [Chloroflexi bacterium]|nr:hypothetical protein [Chloroflexota bacterium]